MSKSKRVYVNQEWRTFSEKVKRRDEGKCLQCGRGEAEVTLQVHHNVYVDGKLPWEYPLSACQTLCKGCHAREHGLIAPDRGWTLLSIDDLGSRDGVCERKGCGSGIRFAHSTYHPKWGYLVVGSTCIEYLTQEDRHISDSVIEVYKKISNFVLYSNWVASSTTSGKPCLSSTYKHHKIRIYGKEFAHSFQLALKEKGVRWHEFQKTIDIPRTSTLVAKELALTALQGTLSETEEEKKVLRNLYRELKANTNH